VSGGPHHPAPWPPAEALASLVARALARQAGAVAPPRVSVVDCTVVAEGRPAVVDLVVAAGDRRWHLAVGLRPPGDEARFLAGTGDPVLGVVDGPGGLVVAFDALADEETAALVLQAAAGVAPVPGGTVRVLSGRAGARRVAFDADAVLTAFTDLSAGQAWVVVLQALVASGFDRMPAPVCFWRRAGHDLGVVQQLVAGAPSGATAALASARAAVRRDGGVGSRPRGAGRRDSDNGADASTGAVAGAGSFSADARAIGQLAGQLHVALFRAFGGRPGDPACWSSDVAAEVAARAPTLAARQDVRRLLDELAVLGVPCTAIRTHGDLVLDRVVRAARGWMLGDGDGVDATGGGATGGGAADGGWPLPYPAGTRRSPVADVADLLWSLGQAAARASAEAVAAGTDPGEARAQAAAWERSARRALVAGYLQVPGVAAVVPADRRALRTLTAAWELARSVRGATAAPGTGASTPGEGGA
jgi:hypothetical protein